MGDEEGTLYDYDDAADVVDDDAQEEAAEALETAAEEAEDAGAVEEGEEAEAEGVAEEGEEAAAEEAEEAEGEEEAEAAPAPAAKRVVYPTDRGEPQPSPEDMMRAIINPDPRSRDTLLTNELALVVAVRAEQIARGGKIFVTPESHDPVDIAWQELEARKNPLVLRREVERGGRDEASYYVMYDEFKVRDMKIAKKPNM